MKSPWVVALLSLFPGLGFLVLGKVRNAVVAFGLFVLLAGYWLFIPPGLFADLIFNLAFLCWLIQIVYAFQVARREQYSRMADPRAAKPAASTTKPLAKVKAADRLRLAALQVLEPQLEPKESLLGAVVGLDMGNIWLFGSFSMKQFFIGATKDHLIRVQMDMMGKPYQVFRDTLDSVSLAWLKHGLIQDRLRIQVQGKKGTTYRVPRTQRDESQRLLELLTQRSSR